MRFSVLLLLFCTIGSALAQESKVISLPLPRYLQRADLVHVPTVPNPVAVLVLCPGCNGNGGSLAEKPAWQSFARDHNLGLLGLSFASDVDTLKVGLGYYYASQGSGQCLLDGVKMVFGRELPIVLYGFSGGAHFTSRFVEWQPEQVKSWCAYSAGWWDEPLAAKTAPPGIVACGVRDERYSDSLEYYTLGRALGKPWLWVEVPNLGHQMSNELDQFVRDYFSSVLQARPGTGEWRHIRSGQPTRQAHANVDPSYGWWPDKSIMTGWRKWLKPKKAFSDR